MSDTDPNSRQETLNTHIAVAVAVLTAALALSNIQNGKLSDEARDAQIASVGTWSQYQAKRIRQILLENSITNALALRTEAMGRQVDRAIVDWQEEAGRYEDEMKVLSETARGFEAEWRRAGTTSGLFSMAETFITVSLAGLAIAALVRRRWMFVLSVFFGLAGIAYAAFGYLGITAMSAGNLLG